MRTTGNWENLIERIQKAVSSFVIVACDFIYLSTPTRYTRFPQGKSGRASVMLLIISIVRWIVARFRSVLLSGI